MIDRAKSRTRRHPGEGTWRAYLDGELPLARRATLRLHALGCPVCRQRLAGARRTAERAAALLGSLPQAVDVSDGWARFMVLAGGSRSTWSPLSAFLAGGLSVATLAASVLLLTPAPTRLLGRVHGASALVGVLDHCCSGDSAVDAIPAGEFTLQVPGLAPTLRLQYADVDGSGNLSTGDVVRSVTRVRRRPR
jgi:hypothetical protein